MRLRQLLHQPAERELAVGAAHRAERRVQARVVLLQVAVVGEHPVPAPQLALERVRVLQRHAALRRLADVGDDVVAADRIAPHHVGHRRVASALRVDEQAHAVALEEGDAEAVLVFLGPRAEAGEAEHDVGRRVRVHAEQLAHRGSLFATR